MKKLITLAIIIIISPFLAGMYGVIHDQITYTISEEYYTKFKFIQFHLESWNLGRNIGTMEVPEIKLDNPRLGVATVGFLATWWVGLIIGLILGFIGLSHKTAKNMFQVTFKAILLTIGIALVTGILGLIYGGLALPNQPTNWSLPDNLENVRRFVMVGSMHNFSYLGGFIGAVFAIRYSIANR